MNSKKNIVIRAKGHQPILTDVFYLKNELQKPVVIFCHGYKGFKDWGAWDILAQRIAEAGFVFVKFNFSHNGGTIDNPIDFPDLEAFANNNYTKELDDLEIVIDWICNNPDLAKEINPEAVHLIGHSRGGGIALIKAEEDSRITKVISVSAVCDYGSRFPMNSDLDLWKKQGVIYVMNGRTKQQMPHFYQFYEDFAQNEERLNINRAVSNLNIPHLIVHGDEDTSVLKAEAEKLKQWNPAATLKLVPSANHVYNTAHPWEADDTPEAFDALIAHAIDFLV